MNHEGLTSSTTLQASNLGAEARHLQPSHGAPPLRARNQPTDYHRQPACQTQELPGAQPHMNFKIQTSKPAAMTGQRHGEDPRGLIGSELTDHASYTWQSSSLDASSPTHRTSLAESGALAGTQASMKLRASVHESAHHAINSPVLDHAGFTTLNP